MKQGQGSKRARGRNSGRRGGGNRQHMFDSNGPSVRIRGSAYQVHEKYLGLARDAASSGERIAAENYYQHAEHYFRIYSTELEERGPRQQTNGQAVDGQRRHDSRNHHGYGRAVANGANGGGGDGPVSGDIKLVDVSEIGTPPPAAMSGEAEAGQPVGAVENDLETPRPCAPSNDEAVASPRPAARKKASGSRPRAAARKKRPAKCKAESPAASDGCDTTAGD